MCRQTSVKLSAITFYENRYNDSQFLNGNNIQTDRHVEANRHFLTFSCEREQNGLTGSFNIEML